LWFCDSPRLISQLSKYPGIDDAISQIGVSEVTCDFNGLLSRCQPILN
jgi:hypothetical protein